MTGDQVHAARKLLGWSAGRLAKACGFGAQVIYRFEATGIMSRSMFVRTDHSDRPKIVQSMLQAEGIVFAPDEEGGVTLRKPRR